MKLKSFVSVTIMLFTVLLAGSTGAEAADTGTDGTGN